MRNNQSTIGRQWLTRARLLAGVLLAVLLAVPIAAQNRPAEPSLQGGGKLKVMTYNVFVGTEYAGVTDPDLAVFLQAATNMVLDIRASDPPGRAQAVARQIAAYSPHLVSLQEVFALSTGPTKDNLTLEFDYLQLLLQALADQGMQYTPVASLTTWDATVPSTLGFVRNTWRVAVIARADLKPEHLSFTNVQAASWTATLVVRLRALDGRSDLCPVPLRPSDGACRMSMPRGWVSADVTYRGGQFRFIGGHLDSGSPLLEIPQGLELLNGPANTALQVIVAADLNCDCSKPSDPFYPTCVNFSNAGFIDAWSAANPFDAGYTRDVPNMTRRSDYVMLRGPFAVQTAALVGEEPGDRTASGLYASDHAGVVIKLERPEQE
jgi:endonuclease/exonuclease/phosphatase family metal-dependent hydrolase